MHDAAAARGVSSAHMQKPDRTGGTGASVNLDVPLSVRAGRGTPAALRPDGRSPMDLSLLAFALSAMDLLGCGAKTGLRVPCVIPLEPVRPAVVLVLDHSNSMHAPTPDGRSSWQVLTDTLSIVLPALDAQIDVGALVFPQRRIDINTPGCDVRLDLGSPVHAMNASSTLTYVASTGEPSGGTPVYVAIERAAAAIGTPGPADPPRYIVLGTDGFPDCNADFTRDTCNCPGPIMSCVGSDGIWTGCLDDVRVVGELRDLARRRVYTFVIGIETDATPLDPRAYAILDAMAIAGGQPSTATNHRFYPGSTPESLTTSFRSTLGSLAACRLRAPSLDVIAAGCSLSAEGIGVIPLDPSHLDGWDWIDASRGELQVFGSACDHVVRAGARPRLVTAARSCVE